MVVSVGAHVIRDLGRGPRVYGKPDHRQCQHRHAREPGDEPPIDESGREAWRGSQGPLMSAQDSRWFSGMSEASVALRLSLAHPAITKLRTGEPHRERVRGRADDALDQIGRVPLPVACERRDTRDRYSAGAQQDLVRRHVTRLARQVRVAERYL